LSRVRVDNLRPNLYATHCLSGGRKLYDIRLENTDKPAHSFSDLEGQMLSFVCQQNSQAEFLHQLFSALLQASDNYVDEQTKFKDFARFSRQVCPSKVAEFSYRTRNITQQDTRFSEHFVDMSYRVDAAKAPNINDGELGERQRHMLSAAEASFGPLAGYLPHNLKR